MKKLILMLVLMTASFSINAQSKVGTIDADFILANLPEITEVNAGLESYGAELEADRDSTITRYESAIKDYQENSAGFTEEEKRTRENEIVTLENEIKNFRQKATVMLQMKRNELTQPLYEKINEAMIRVVKEEGFTQILHGGSNALAYSAEGSDITMKVLEELGIDVEALPTERD